MGLMRTLQRCITFGFLLCAVAAAHAQAVYGIGGTATNCSTAYTNVYTVSLTTGAATSVGTLSFASTASTNRSSDNVLFYIERIAAANPRLASWNPATSTNTIIATTTLPADMLRMAFAPDGKLYASSNTNQIFEINPATGATIRTITHNISTGGSGDFSFTEGGDLYAVANDTVAGNPYQLWLIPQAQISSQTNVTATQVGANLGIANTIAPNGMAPIPPTGTCTATPCFLVSTGASNATYLVNGTTGAGTLVGTTGACLVDLGRGFQTNLFIGKTDGVTAVNAGGSTVYTLTVTNSGPSAIYNTPVVDTAPANVTFGAWTCAVTTAGTGSNVTTACGAASGSGNLNTTVTMRSGAVITYTVNATVAGGATGSISNVTTITPLTGVANQGTSCVTSGGITRAFTASTGECSSTDVDTINLLANITVTKSDSRNTVVNGETVSYSVAVNNPGPSAADGTQVLDAPPAALTGCAVSNCTATGGAACPAAANWPNLLATPGVAIPTLPASGGVTFTLSCTVAATGQ